MRDVLINLLASAIAAAVAWIAQATLRYRKVARKRAFFGVRPGREVMLFVARHATSPRPQSVHRNDVATLVELAASIKESGGDPTLVPADDGRREFGRVTEYCVGGPGANPRVAAHLRSALPGVRFSPYTEADGALTFQVGDQTYQRRPEVEEFVLLARFRPSTSDEVVFVLAGQTALTNLAAARYLTAHYPALRKRYRRRDFCLVLAIREPKTFGADRVELVADLTDQAFTRPAGWADEPDQALVS